MRSVFPRLEPLSSVVACLLLLITVSLSVRRPERQVISEQLHYERTVLVGVFIKCVQFGDGIIKGLLRKLTGFIRRVHDLVVENRKVEREPQTDRVSRLHFAY